jgi:phosphoribosylglycinamide formyltransferase-1
VSFPIAVLVSGEGTNLQALLDTVHGEEAEVVGVAASRAEARGLERARRVGVETAVFAKQDYADRGERDRALADWIDSLGARLVVLAGFMELLGPEFIGRFPNAIVNVHPALLPAFAGVNAIEQALDYGVKVGGVTVHFVDEGIDSGAIILQRSFELPYPRDITAVEQQVHQIEHELLPQAVRLIAQDKVSIDPAHPRWVIIDE